VADALDPMGLEPCPFCGGKGELDSGAGDFSRCYCTTCDAQSEEHEEAAEAIAAWNRRAYLSTVIPAEIAGVVEKLEKRADQVGMLLSDPPKPHPDNKLLREAASLIERLAASQAETRRLALEEAAKVCEQYDGKPCGPAELWAEDQRQFYDAGQIDASMSSASAIRALIDQPSTEGGKDEGR
jgi:Lar family restriction alleviation protein